MLAFLLACAATPTAGAPDACLHDDDPPGDPIYRDCVVTAEGHDPAEWHTDAEGRTVYAADEDYVRTWDRTFEDGCETRTETTCARTDGRSCGAWIETRTCGNPALVTTEYTDADGDVYVTTVTYTYTYDDAGHAVLTEASDGDGPPSLTTCTWSDADGPDGCVDDRGTADDATDDLSWAWEYDDDGLAVAYAVQSLNPGWYAESTWVRGLHGHTLARETYDSALSERCTYEYAYDGRALASRSVTCGMSGPIETTYRYRVR